MPVKDSRSLNITVPALPSGILIFLPLVQVPRAPSSCTVVFDVPKDAAPDSTASHGWNIHGGDSCHAALSGMPEWAEVIITFSLKY